MGNGLHVGGQDGCPGGFCQHKRQAFPSFPLNWGWDAERGLLARNSLGGQAWLWGQVTLWLPVNLVAIQQFLCFLSVSITEEFEVSQPCLAAFYIHHLPTFGLKCPQFPPHCLLSRNSSLRFVDGFLIAQFELSTRTGGQSHVSYRPGAAWEPHLAQANFFY